MSKKEVLSARIEKTRNNAITLFFADILIGQSCDNDTDITKEWAAKAEEILSDIDRKYQEFYKHCEDLHQATEHKRNCIEEYTSGK